MRKPLVDPARARVRWSSPAVRAAAAVARCTLALAFAAPMLATAAPSAALGYAPKYPRNFTHFEYVNPQAPKGGQLAVSVLGNYAHFNPFILKGIAAAGVGELVIEPLMVQSEDEPYSVYAHLAEDIALAPDRLSVTFRLDPRARFSNGDAVTADDVKFSFDTLVGKHAHPRYRFYWSDIKSATVLDSRTVRFDFAKVNPELYLLAAQMPVFARKWIGAKSFDKVTGVAPIGSGPYVLRAHDLGKSVTYERNPNYWARELPTRKGMYNFERVVFRYYLDETVIFEALKTGEFDFFYETLSKRWAREYNGPQFRSGRIKKREIKHFNNAGMQGFVFNLRRPLFHDARVRRAVALALDFEWSNRNLFYGQYTRCDSYFSNSELAATGIPTGDELKLLEPFRAQLPASVFTKVWRPPSTAAPGSLRENLKTAQALLAEAGWRLHDGRLQNARGERLEFEVMLAQKGFERIMAPFARNLAKIGIVAHYRTVDTSLYQRRTDTFNFDIVVESFGQSQSPGNELINFWHSSTAAQEGSANIIGIKNPVIDKLIEKVIYAPDRKRLVTAIHALDRVMLHEDYLVPNWYIATHRIAYWDRFEFPKTLPRYYQATPWALETWWVR